VNGLGADSVNHCGKPPRLVIAKKEPWRRGPVTCFENAFRKVNRPSEKRLLSAKLGHAKPGSSAEYQEQHPLERRTVLGGGGRKQKLKAAG